MGRVGLEHTCADSGSDVQLRPSFYPARWSILFIFLLAVGQVIVAAASWLRFQTSRLPPVRRLASAYSHLHAPLLCVNIGCLSCDSLRFVIRRQDVRTAVWSGIIAPVTHCFFGSAALIFILKAVRLINPLRLIPASAR